MKLEDECKELHTARWIEQSSRCPKAAPGFEPYHKWISINKILTPHAEIVTGIMCGICFYEVVISEAHKHRDCFKT